MIAACLQGLWDQKRVDAYLMQVRPVISSVKDVVAKEYYLSPRVASPDEDMDYLTSVRAYVAALLISSENYLRNGKNREEGLLRLKHVLTLVKMMNEYPSCFLELLVVQANIGRVSDMLVHLRDMKIISEEEFLSLVQEAGDMQLSPKGLYSALIGEGRMLTFLADGLRNGTIRERDLQEMLGVNDPQLYYSLKFVNTQKISSVLD